MQIESQPYGIISEIQDTVSTVNLCHCLYPAIVPDYLRSSPERQTEK